jgi:hypothetical protein
MYENELNIGQLGDDKTINGVGRKINLEQGAIDEGLFKNNMLNGFGRRIKSDGTFTTGFWNNGSLHGYALRVIQKPEIFIELGHYVNHVLQYEQPKDVKGYNAETEIFA